MSVTKRKWRIIRTPQFEEDLKKMPPEDQAEIEEALKKLAEDPYIGEPAKPCPSCGGYFFHSDKTCPFCGASVNERDLGED